jgi:mannose-6-phosphate isomerase-like protein (cupin superfamily)
MPKTSSETATNVADYGIVVDRSTEMDGYTINFVTINEDQDLAPALASLPDGQCHCPHWGVINKGQMTVTYADHEEVFEAGEAFYMPPGHTPRVIAGTEFVQFSPSDLLAETEAAIAKGMAQHS